MAWVKATEWLPEGQDLHVDYPHVIVADSRSWPLLRGEVGKLNPDYPVILLSPFMPLYGQRVRSIDTQYVPAETKLRKDWKPWLGHIETRIDPKGQR